MVHLLGKQYGQFAPKPKQHHVENQIRLIRVLVAVPVIQAKQSHGHTPTFAWVELVYQKQAGIVKPVQNRGDKLRDAARRLKVNNLDQPINRGFHGFELHGIGWLALVNHFSVVNTAVNNGVHCVVFVCEIKPLFGDAIVTIA
jgi:hypothetical protein